MKKTLIYIVIAAVIVGIIYLIANQKEQYFAKVPLNGNNSVFNVTKYKYIDTVIKLGLDNIGLKKTIVVVKPLTESLKGKLLDENRQLVAHVHGSNGVYTIWVDDSGMSRNEFIDVFSHECWHIKQYETKRLVVGGKYPKWLGKEYDLETTAYMDRPWEIEAYNKQANIKKYIVSKVYPDESKK